MPAVSWRQLVTTCDSQQGRATGHHVAHACRHCRHCRHSRPDVEYISSSEQHIMSSSSVSFHLHRWTGRGIASMTLVLVVAMHCTVASIGLAWDMHLHTITYSTAKRAIWSSHSSHFKFTYCDERQSSCKLQVGETKSKIYATATCAGTCIFTAFRRSSLYNIPRIEAKPRALLGITGLTGTKGTTYSTTLNKHNPEGASIHGS